MSNSEGFKHSVKVNTQYKKIAQVLKTASERKKSLKSLIFEAQHVSKRAMQALLNHYITNRAAIDNAIEKSGILKENPQLCPSLCVVLVTELLYGRKQLNGSSKPVLTVYKYHPMLKAAVECTEEQKGSITTKKAVTKLRYIRVNSNIYSVAEAMDMLIAEQWRKKELMTPNPTYDDFLKAAAELEEDEFLSDMHVSDLFVFHSKTRHYWPTDPFVMEKKLILQDKGTSLVAEMLDPRPGAVLLDLCAAPGIKTIHLCNVMRNQGKIYAIEQDPDRYNLLLNMTKSAGCKIVMPILADALTIGNDDCPGVEYVVVDPSCSGSGMQNRMSLDDTDNKDHNRLKKLAGLQIKMLSHAMTSFPLVKRIAYSTCSIYEEENEQVVQRCLQIHPDFKLLSGRKTLRNKWPHFGNPTYSKVGKNCVYTRPDIDLADGIFIAVFEKRGNT